MIPGLNDSADNIRTTADHVSELGVYMLELLPYHRLGENKYAQLDMEYKLSEIREPSDEHMAQLADIAREVTAGHRTDVHVMPSF